jgi:tripartite-type tricarboxylate transporter receptor subunit TctC
LLTNLRSFAALVGILAVAGSPAALRAQTYPAQPITLVVPSAPGGIVDTTARLVAGEMSANWKVPVLVDNKPGANSIVGTTFVSRAPKDGYTVLFTYTAHVQTVSLNTALPYDPLKDFSPLAQIGMSNNILAVLPGFPANTLAEFVDLVRRSPGKYSYGTFGNASSAHINGETLKREAKLDMTHVPYKGGAPLVADLLAGHVPVAMSDVGTAMPHLRAGKIKPLAINGVRRSSLLPDVPTFAEAGYKGFEPIGWIGVLFPAGVPAERASAMSVELMRIVKLPQIQQRLRELNIDPTGIGSQEFGKVLAEDMKTWGRLVGELNIRQE